MSAVDLERWYAGTYKERSLADRPMTFVVVLGVSLIFFSLASIFIESEKISCEEYCRVLESEADYSAPIAGFMRRLTKPASCECYQLEVGVHEATE